MADSSSAPLLPTLSFLYRRKTPLRQLKPNYFSTVQASSLAPLVFMLTELTCMFPQVFSLPQPMVLALFSTISRLPLQASQVPLISLLSIPSALQTMWFQPLRAIPIGQKPSTEWSSRSLHKERQPSLPLVVF